MAKRTFAIVAVFAALLSVTLSVQADNLNYYWVGGGDTNYWTNTNWRIGSTTGDTPAAGSMNNTANSITAYMQNTNSVEVILNYDQLGAAVTSLNIGTAGSASAVVILERSGGYLYIQNEKALNVIDGGKFNFAPTSTENAHSLIIQNGGTVALSGGEINFTRKRTDQIFEIQSGGRLNISGGTLTSDAAMTVAGTMTLSDGTLKANNISIGSNGTFTHSGGTLTTNGSGLSITGNYTLGSSATLKPDGPISVSGTAALSGTIDVSGYTASAPSVGSTYTLVSANTLTDSATLSLPSGWIKTRSNTALKIAYENGEGNFYWKGSSSSVLFFSGNNWVYNDENSEERLIATDIGNRSHNPANYTRHCFVYETAQNKDMSIDWSDLGVASLTIGDGDGSSRTATAVRSGKLYLWTTVTVQDGGTLKTTGLDITRNGTLNLTGGTIKIGADGITHSGDPNHQDSNKNYTINLSGGTFGTNSASWTSALTANIASGTAVTFAPASGKTITWSGALTGSGGVTVDGAGTLTLSGNNTYSGGTTITAGTLKLADGGTLGSGNVTNNANLEIATDAGRDFSTVISGTGSLTKTGTGVLRYSGAGTYSGGTNISGGAIRLDPNGSLGSGTINIAAGADLRFAGSLNGITISNTITGAGGLTKQGTGNTVTLSGDLSGFTGTLTTNGENGQTGSTIKLTGANTNLVNASAVVNNGTLDVSDYSGSTTMQLNKLSGAGIVNIGSKPIILNNAASADSTTFSGVINGSGSVTKTGAGTLELTGANDYSGVTTISTGTLKLSGSGALGTGSIVDNATLEFAHTGTQSFSNVISGTGAVTKTGSGTVTLSGANTYSGGTTISAGALVLSENGTLGAGDVENNAVLEFAHSSNMDFSNVISGTGAVNKTGTGTLTLSGANTYTGLTTVSAGVLELTGDAVVANGPVSVGANGTLEYEVGKDGNNQPITKKLSISEINKIVSTGQVIKTGKGTLQLYSAAQGLIDVESLTVSSGRIDLKGYMTGGITVDADGVFSPGNSVGEATFGGNYILKEGATLLIEQDGSGIDKLNVGSFTFDETSISKGIELDITGIPFGSQYDIITSSTDFTGDLLSDEYWLKHFKNDLPDYMTLVVVNNNTVRLSIDRNAVPEPSTWALLILGAAGMLYWRKRKNA